MSDYDKDNFTPDEVDRIQQEIDKTLETSEHLDATPDCPPVLGQSDDDAAQFDDFKPYSTPDTEISETKTPEYNATAFDATINSTDYSGSEYSFPSECTIKEGLGDSGRETFYRETIRNESIKNSGLSFKRVIAVAVVVSILGGLFAGVGFGVGPTIYNTYFAKAAPNVEQEDEAIFAFSKDNEQSTVPNLSNNVTTSVQGLPNFVDVVKSVQGAVVTITTKTVSTNNFFDMQVEQPSAGTGIIFSTDDNNVYIVTNAHVVTGANSVQVAVEGSEPVVASPIDGDIQADIAVISVSKSDLSNVGINNIKTASFGDSDKLEVGEWVLALGNALGDGNTATVGIISAKDKKVTIENRELEVIQTSAAINPGNSGGPLINTKGEVIGINTAKLAKSNNAFGGTYAVEGMGYSITSNKAMPIIEDLMGRTSQAFLGIEGQDITQEISDMYGLPTLGVFVRTVIKGSAAETAGVIPTDIITSFDGKTIFTMKQLSEYIKEHTVGDEIELKLLRDGKTPMTIVVKLAKYSRSGF